MEDSYVEGIVWTRFTNKQDRNYCSYICGYYITTERSSRDNVQEEFYHTFLSQVYLYASDDPFYARTGKDTISMKL